MEQPGFFEHDGTSLFGVVHTPAGEPRPLAFVLSHPFGEEKLWAHRAFVSFARLLAARGHAVLRFDYRGCGDSGGELATSSLHSHIGDLAAAIDYLVRRQPVVRQVGLAGLRFGATIAALAAERATGQTRDLLTGAPLVLWDPVTDGEAWLGEMLRSHLSTQMAVFGRVVETRDVLRERIGRGEWINLDGYDLAAPLYDSCCAKDLLDSTAKSFGGATLVTQIAANENQKPRVDLQALAGAYPRGSFARCTEEPFWKEIRAFYGRAPQLEASTCAWLDEHYHAVI